MNKKFSSHRREELSPTLNKMCKILNNSSLKASNSVIFHRLSGRFKGQNNFRKKFRFPSIGAEIARVRFIDI